MVESPQIGDALAFADGTELNGLPVAVETAAAGDPWPRVPAVIFFGDMSPETLSGLIQEASAQGSILIMGEQEGFLELGGHVQLFMKSQTVRFGVNLSAATESGLTFRSRLLRLAERILN